MLMRPVPDLVSLRCTCYAVETRFKLVWYALVSISSLREAGPHCLPNTQVMRVLGRIDSWTFDSFELDEVTNHRPLSTLGFMLMKRQGIVDCLKLDEARLAR